MKKARRHKGTKARRSAGNQRLPAFFTSCLRAFVPSCLLLAAALLGAPAQAQFGDNPVYVDDSPRAWELFRRAADHVRDNPGEAARLYQEVLDEYALKLIPVNATAPDHFASARLRVNAAIGSDEALLARYRTIETPRAERLLEGGQLEFLIETRFLTEPALEALLRLAQSDLESARFATAVRRLLEAGAHPDLAGRRAAHRWFMLGLAANHIENTDLRGQAINALAMSNDPGWRALHDELLRLLQAGPGPQELRGLTVLDVAPDADVEAIVTTPIWDVRLEETPVNQIVQVSSRPAQRIQMDNHREHGQYLNAAPTVAGRAVIVNEGHHIRAFDRFSHRQFWEARVGTPTSINQRQGRSIGDLNVVAVYGELAVTLTSHASDQNARQSGEIACLDRETGELRWRVDLSKALSGEEYSGMYPHGAPVIADGMVFMLGRRQSGQSLISGYVIALDLYEGELRWVRYIASCGGLQNSASRPFSTIQYDAGDLFVASALGAAARLKPANGEIIWLRRQTVPLRPVNVEPWSMSIPVITRVGIFAVAPDAESIVQLDRETGTELKRVPARAWGSPQYLLGSGEWLYAVGDGDVMGGLQSDPREPLWRLTDAVPNLGFDDIRGRAQLAGDTLVIPTTLGIYCVNGQTGDVLRRVPITGASNPLVVGSEMFVAQTDRLAAFVPLSVAEARLREQILESSDDPDAALSLLRLAVQVARGDARGRADDPDRAVDLALESAQYASAAIDRMKPGDARREAQMKLFELLIAVAEANHEIDYDRGLALHGRIGAAAATIEQRIEHLLARGDWLTDQAQRGDRAYLAEAIDSYQTILSDETLAQAERERDGVVAPASRLAVDRLASILSAFGEEAYAPLASSAERRLAALGPDASAADLIELMREFPFAPASRQAGLAAAQQYIARGDARAALALLGDLLASATEPLMRREILGRIVRLSLDSGWENLATSWLLAARDSLGAATLPDPRTGEERTIDAWLTLAGGRPRLIEPRPRLGLIAAQPNEIPRSFEAVLVPLNATLERAPSTFALLREADPKEGNVISRIGAKDLAVEWRTPLPDIPPTAPAELVSYTPQRIVLHVTDFAELIVLDPVAGEIRSRSGSLLERLKELAVNDRNIGGRGVLIPGQGTRVGDPFQPLLLTLDDAIFALGRGGGAMRMDLGEGSEPRPSGSGAVAARGSNEQHRFLTGAALKRTWERDHPLEVLHFAAAHDLAIVATGQKRDPDTRNSVGQLVLLDPVTGATLHTIDTRDGEIINWLVVLPQGIAICGTGTAIEAVDLTNGERRWSNISADAGAFTRGWASGGSAIVADLATRLQMIDTDTGHLGVEFRPAPDRSGEPDKLENVIILNEQQALAHYRERIVIYNADGSVHGQDIIPAERKFTHVLPGSDRFAVISHVSNPDDGRRNRAFVDIIYIFSQSCKVLDEVSVPSDRSDPTGVAAIDGWILLSNDTRTQAVPTR